jgi:Tol biopolymer transport system component
MQIGARLGAYEVIAKLGEGGMGQVYRATDTTLGRQVAIKILPDAFAGDADRLARFEREAKTLASLNHPHIAAIYGFEKSAPSTGSGQAAVYALVMELVEGEDLSQRLARELASPKPTGGGGIPIDEALPIARQIAEALEAAHEQGIVHRDLKPANIKLRGDGTVKVLDFGLARVGAPAGSSPDARNSPTFTSPAALTMGGMILGTAAYMAPEQARGKTVDKRADIWAFGLVLYEMLTGRIAFAGDTISDVLAAVLTREPDWTALPATTPASIKRLLARCLEKDPKRRLRDIGDARLEIEETTRDPVAGPASVAAAPRVRPFAWTATGFAAATIAIVGLAASGVWPRARTPEARPLRVSLVHTEGSEVGAPAISPDGRRVAYRARRSDGMPLLWVRDLASGEAQPLAGTEDASLPFWSPDSSDLGFFSGVSLKRVSAVGGPVRILVDYVGTYGGAGGTWSSDGTIVFSGQLDLVRVPANGGAVSIVTKAPTQDWSYYWPTFLPDGRRFLFTAKLWTRTAEASDQGIYIGSLDNPKIERLLPDLSSAVYAPPGYLVFARNGTPTALSFDLVAGRVTGSPVPIGGAVATESQFYFAGISASADGTLAVRPPPAVTLSGPGMNSAQAELQLVDRAGRGSRVSSARLFSFTMAFSPVDSRVAAAAILDPRAGTSDLWLVDLTKDTAVPLTTTRGFASYPVWSADGKRMAYAYQPPGGMDDVYVKDIASGGIAPLIEAPRTIEHPIAWSHDERTLLAFTDDDKGTYVSSWSFAARALTRVAGPRVIDARAFFSPRDDFIAYTSQESGRPEVFVTAFPEPRQTWPLTTGGGQVIGWRRDGGEILVATLSGHIAAYPVTTEGGFSHGEPTTLVRNLGTLAVYTIATPDHSRLLIRVSPDAAQDKGEIRLLFGWQEGVRQRNP